MKNKVRPFSNMKDYSMWREDNCIKCKIRNKCALCKSIDDSTLETYIPLMNAEAIGFFYVQENPSSEYVVLNRKCNLFE